MNTVDIIRKGGKYVDDAMEMLADGESTSGICIECGETRDCVEPDAEGYACDVCGESAVFGLEQIIILCG